MATNNTLTISPAQSSDVLSLRGTTSVVDGKIRQLTGSSQEAMLTAPPTDLIEVAVEVTIEQLTASNPTVVLMAAEFPSRVRGYFLIVRDNTAEFEVEKRDGSTGAGTVIFNGAAVSTTDNRYRFRATRNVAGTQVALAVDSWDGAAWVEEHTHTDSSSPYTSGGVGVAKVGSSPGTVDYSDFTINYRRTPQCLTATLYQDQLVATFSEPATRNGSYIDIATLYTRSPQLGVLTPEYLAGDGSDAWTYGLRIPINAGDVLDLLAFTSSRIETSDGIVFLFNVTDVVNLSTRTGAQVQAAYVWNNGLRGNLYNELQVKLSPEPDDFAVFSTDGAHFEGTVGGSPITDCDGWAKGGINISVVIINTPKLADGDFDPHAVTLAYNGGGSTWPKIAAFEGLDAYLGDPTVTLDLNPNALYPLKAGVADQTIVATASGGSPPGGNYAFEIVGEAPAGLVLSSAADEATLTTTAALAAGNHAVTLQASDGTALGTTQITLDIRADDPATAAGAWGNDLYTADVDGGTVDWEIATDLGGFFDDYRAAFAAIAFGANSVSGKQRRLQVTGWVDNGDDTYSAGFVAIGHYGNDASGTILEPDGDVVAPSAAENLATYNSADAVDPILNDDESRADLNVLWLTYDSLPDTQPLIVVDPRQYLGASALVIDQDGTMIVGELGELYTSVGTQIASVVDYRDQTMTLGDSGSPVLVPLAGSRLGLIGPIRPGAVNVYAYRAQINTLFAAKESALATLGDRFEIRDPEGNVLAEIDGLVRSYPLESLELPVGRHSLSMIRVEGTLESTADTLTVEVGESAAVTATINPSDPRLRATAGGAVVLTWQSVDRTGRLGRPAVFEIADVDDLDTILATATGGVGVRSAEIEGFDDAELVQLAVRWSDGQVEGERGAWVYSNAIAADDAGPPVPTAYAGSSGV